MLNNILILPENMARIWNPDRPAAIFRIRGWHLRTEGMEDLIHHSKFAYINQWYFDDQIPSRLFTAGLSGHPLKKEQAEDIVKQIKLIEPEIELLVIHCAAGISRSPAVALAIAEYYKLWHIVQNIVLQSRRTDGLFSTGMHYFPNAHVLKLMRQAFGILATDTERQEMYNQMFGKGTNPNDVGVDL